MIKIIKSAAPPNILLNEGVTRLQSVCTLYNSGQKNFRFDSKIYADASVKQGLIADQNKKCCFCESVIDKDGDVEHFRPKGGMRQSKTSPLIQPGYYWLAYSWGNLLWSCSICNSRYKLNLFPLINPSCRALSHYDNVDAELPAFVNPVEDNPEDLIQFRAEVAYAVTGNFRGSVTIDALGLNRSSLIELRGQHLSNMNLLRRALANLPIDDNNAELTALRQSISEKLIRMLSNSAVYSSMMRCAVAADFSHVVR